MKSLYRITILAIAFAACAAFAQGSPSPAPSPGFAEQLLTGQFAAAALGAVGVVLGGLKFLTIRRKKLIGIATYHAFHIVEDIAAETEGEDAFDKVAAGLKAANEYMLAQGWRPLKPGEEDQAKLGFQSLHGVQIASAKTQARAQELVAAAAVPSPR